MTNAILSCSYLIASALCILAIRGLASPRTARSGNILGMVGMSVAVIATLSLPAITDIRWILAAIAAGALVGIFSALKVKMTALPQMIAAFNGLGGLAAVFISASEIFAGSEAYAEASIGMLIGAVAFSGSLIAFAKLQGLMPSGAIVFSGQQGINLIFALGIIGTAAAYITNGNIALFEILVSLSIILGILLILPIGGADMPVVISVLNAYSGWAAVGIGFSLNNVLLIIVGAIVGASGAILSYIMTKAMNRSLVSVMLGGFGLEQNKDEEQKTDDRKTAKSGNPQDAAFIL